MKKIVLPLVAMALTVLLSLSVSGSIPEDAQALTAKPNIVFILTDDMRKDDLKYMPKTRSVLKVKGMSFSNAFVSNALCCLSRATIMRGQYAHNTGIWTNKNVGRRAAVGQAYKNKGNEKDNVATRLDAAGYRTALIGRYLSGIKKKLELRRFSGQSKMWKIDPQGGSPHADERRTISAGIQGGGR
jgi:N-acetylglucosamine-6-sulfatase